MSKLVRSSLGAALVAIGFALASAPAAEAQVRFQGSFPLPHGRITIGLPDPFFPLRSFVPDGYSVYDDAQYGYGFSSGDEWIPCERYDGRWMISGRPIFFGRRNSRYLRPYRDDYRYSQQYRRGFEERRDARFDRPFRERFDSRRDQRFARDDRGRGQERRFNREGRDRRDGRGSRDGRDSRRDHRDSGR
jgi:hypothetical protein